MTERGTSNVINIQPFVVIHIMRWDDNRLSICFLKVIWRNLINNKARSHNISKIQVYKKQIFADLTYIYIHNLFFCLLTAWSVFANHHV